MEANARVSKMVKPQDCLLIVIDVQKKLTPLIAATPEIVANILKLIRHQVYDRLPFQPHIIFS